MNWHIQSGVLERYARGEIDTPQAFSIEAHVPTCEKCSAELTTFVDAARLDRIWGAITTALVVPRPGTVERVLRRLSVSDHTARLLTATPSLQLSWFLAVGAVLSLAVAAAHVSDRGYLVFLVVAPLLPLAGVAAAYGPGIDPTYEIGVAAPMRGTRLLFVRAAAVLVCTVALGAGAALLLPELDWKVAAWLLPSFGLVTASLALGTFIHPLWAAGLVSGSWVAVTMAGARAAMGPLTARQVFGEIVQVVALVVMLLALVLLAARRDHLERGEHQ
jgi:hypothetical protein